MPYFGSKFLSESTNMTLSLAKSIATRIKNKSKSDAKQPVGNQNCLLCTFCAEAQFKGINILPRPVYSPRDIVFKYINIVDKPKKIHFISKEDIVSKINNGERYHCHVNWSGSSGGHEFLLLGIDNSVYVMDAQEGIVVPIDSSKGSYYFKDIKFKNSYMVRVDNSELNKDLMKYNDTKYTLEWDEEKDIKYLESNKE